jgi:hypothetical protein
VGLESQRAIDFPERLAVLGPLSTLLPRTDVLSFTGRLLNGCTAAPIRVTGVEI